MMHRSRIIDGKGQSLMAKRRHNRIASIRPDRILRPYGVRPGRDFRRYDMTSQSFGIGVRDSSTGIDFTLKNLQLLQKNCRLYRVQPAV